MLRRCRICVSAQLVVSQRCGWRRLHAQPPGDDRAVADQPAHATTAATAVITLIPMLHVASTQFYDDVLQYIADPSLQNSSYSSETAVPRHQNTVVFLEGLMDSEQQRIEQEEESRAIFEDAKLREMVRTRALNNELFSLETMRDMCAEMHIDFAALQRFSSSVSAETSRNDKQGTVRLQDAYFRPLLTALCGDRVVHADLTFPQCFAAASAPSNSASSSSFSSSPWLSGDSLAHIGRHPQVKAARERHCAFAVRQRIVDLWKNPNSNEKAISSTKRLRSIDESDDDDVVHIVVPWGMHHMEGLLQALQTGAAASLYRGKTLTFGGASDHGGRAAVAETEETHDGNEAMQLRIVSEAAPFREESFQLPEEFASTFR